MKDINTTEILWVGGSVTWLPHRSEDKGMTM